MIEANRILLFDGVCNLCNGMVQFVIKRDKNAIFRFASLQSASGQELLKKWNLPLSDFNSFVYLRGENCFTRSEAVLQVLKDLGGIWKLLYAFKVLPSFLRDPVYEFIAKRRYKLFGKREECMLPTADIKNRFLE